MLPIGALLGVLLGTLGSATGGAKASVASIPMSLQDVAWSDIEATHRGHDRWVDEELPGQITLPDGLDPSQVTIDYRLPDSLQITSFALVVTGPTDAQALDVAAIAGDLLIAHAVSEADSGLEADKAAATRRLESATTELSTIEATLADLRSEQSALVAKKASEATISVVTGNVWVTETERVEWVREVNSARTELNRLNSVETSTRPLVAALGAARLEQATNGGGPTKPLAGALVGTWVAAIAAYWRGLKRGRVEDGEHPALLELGVPVSNLGHKALDSAASRSLADSIERAGMPASIVDVGPSDGGADAMCLILVDGLGVDPRSVRPLSDHDDEGDMIGSFAILLAVSRETRIDQLLNRARRCQELDVPVVRIVLVGRPALDRLQDWARSQPLDMASTGDSDRRIMVG